MVWVNSGTDYPEMRLLLDSAGRGVFEGGFVFFNPIRWTYDSARSEFALRLAGVDSGTLGVFADGVSRGYALRVNADSTLVLRLDSTTRSLWIAGFDFIRDTMTSHRQPNEELKPTAAPSSLVK